MTIARRFLERRLAAFLGARVQIGRFTASVAGPRVEAADVVIAFNGAAASAVRVARLVAEVSFSRALHRAIVVKSVAVERPVVCFVQRADGRFHLPRPRTDSTAPRGDNGRGWRLDVERVLVVDGEVRVLSEWPPLRGYEVSFAGVLAELVGRAGGFDFTVIARPASAGGMPVSGVELRSVGRISPEVAGGHGLSAEVDVGSALTAAVRHRTDGADSHETRIEMTGEADLGALTPYLPRPFRGAAGHAPAAGSVRLAASMSHVPGEGWSVSNLQLSAAGVRFPKRG